ncbi:MULTISPECIES: hypothetical protein [Paraburkholderia]|jgi:hypothetical protein|uniref:Uncharacterized protein n=1 Tax=Paraburkholderia phenazinium TaxID=60549 RepID=A0A1N6JPF8_9BURK|nr:hypothetical protein [Paraburkholderia phenazinium]SIO46123.1 hypothetical protein SAMN05444168_4756 [Paraburkholderia phenazinium]
MITEQDIAAFINCVDEAKKIDPLQPNGESQQEIWTRVHETICIPEGRPAGDMRALGRTLFRRAQLEPQLGIYAAPSRHFMHGTSNGEKLRDFSEVDKWCEAIRYLDLLQKLSGHRFDPSSTLGMERDLAVTDAVARLKGEGYRFFAKDERINFEEGELERCASDIFDAFREVDGFRISYLVLKHLQANKRFKGGRYLTGRISRSTTERNPQPAPPLGYLLNLAAANLSAERVTGFSEESVRKILQRATDIVAVLDVETYTTYAHMATSHDRLPIYLQELLIADHVLAFRQIHPADATEMMIGLFDWVDNEDMRSKIGWAIDDLQALMQWLFDYVPAETINATLSRETFAKAGIHEDRLGRLLADVSHDPSTVNKAYRTPLDATKADVGMKPLFATNDGRYFLFSPSLSSVGFYEIAAAKLRSVFGSHVDQDIGNAIEPMVAGMFRTRGIEPAIVSCKYDMRGTAGECDIVVETDQAVILIELKKKSMTRAALAGDSYSGFVDLFGGVLSAQEQLGQHEVLLREFGHIKFVDGRQIDLHGRRVERLAVTLLDWGGTQDGMVLRAIMPTLIGASLNYSAATAKQSDQLAKLNSTLGALGTQHTKLLSLGYEPRDMLTNWWFMSVPQLMALLRGVNDANGFYGALRRVGSITTGSLDFYQELEWRVALEHNVQTSDDSGSSPVSR